MGWRIVFIEDAQRLNYKLDSIGIKKKEETFWINIKEIDTLIICDTRCVLTTYLLVELMQNNVDLIFCKKNLMPIGSTRPFFANARSSKSNRRQLYWTNDISRIVWKEIVKNKIMLQSDLLLSFGHIAAAKKINQYVDEVKDGDITNREGIAAKIYFRTLFGVNFSRKDDLLENSCLNFTYQIIRSKIAQEIVAFGYNPAIGIFHISEYNQYNLADDLIEVYRPFCDKYVLETLNNYNIGYLTSQIKKDLLGIFMYSVYFDGKKYKLMDSIKLYISQILNALTYGEISNLKKIYFDE